MKTATLNGNLKVAFEGDWFVTDNSDYRYSNFGLTIVHKYIDGLKAYVGYRTIGRWNSDKTRVSVTYADWQGNNNYDKRSTPPHVFQKMNTPKQGLNIPVFAKMATAKMIDLHATNTKIVADRTAKNIAFHDWQKETIAFLNANANGVFDKYAKASRWVNTATIADIRANDYEGKKVSAFVKVGLDKATKIVDLIASDEPVKINNWSTSFSTLEVKYVLNNTEKKADISFNCSKEIAVKIFNLILDSEE